MAQMITAEELRLVKSRHPDAAVVCYVNTTADVKAESDICCTSSNAVKVVNAVEEDEIIFVPDQNLGRYAQRFTKKTILPWEGFCIVHDRIHAGTGAGGTAGPPGCGSAGAPRVPAGSDRSRGPCGEHIGDHQACLLIRTAEFIIGTEVGILHRIGKDCPGKRCYPLSPAAICRNMKKTTLGKSGIPCRHSSPASRCRRMSLPGHGEHRTDAGTALNLSKYTPFWCSVGSNYIRLFVNPLWRL